ncbi:MAG: efflux RND transporter periplasmic adaptor subunit [Phycisphaeraceae bacterium]|nr:efflux RND transporter periplasmic adaptor subunit [Phycisphaeraceae bacterium]
MNWSRRWTGGWPVLMLSRRMRAGVAALAVLSAPGAVWSVDGPQERAGSAARAGGGTWEEQVQSFGGSAAQILPCRDVVMKFAFPTEVAEVRVRGGERVKQGDLLVRARDADIVAALEQQRLVAGSDLEIQGATVQHELANFRFDQLKIGKVFTPEDFERAKADAATTRVQLAQARLNLETQQSRLKQLEGQFERYRLEAPFDGIIDQVLVDVGRGVGENTDVLRLVNTEQLWLDAFPPTDETLRLNLAQGSPAWVLVNVPGKSVMLKGRVLHVSPAADYVGQTRRVRVEIDNPREWPAGLQGAVRFTQPSQEWMEHMIESRPGAGAGSAPMQTSELDGDGEGDGERTASAATTIDRTVGASER